MPLADPRRPTLLGLSPEAMAVVQGPRGAAAEDLDWEVPARPTPGAAVGTVTDKLPAVAAAPAAPAPAHPAIGSATLKLPAVATAAAAAMAPPTTEAAPAAPAPASPPEAKAEEPDLRIDVEEVAPDSKPSGIGEKYVPKDEGAPPVVLNEDVQAAERGAQAALEAQHRARRAPTIARLKVVEMPDTLVSAEPFVAPKRSNGRFVALAIGVVVLVAGTALVLGSRSKSSTDKVGAAPDPTETVALDTAAPPPPPLPSAEAAAAAAPSPTPEAPLVTPTPAEAAPPATDEKAPEPAPKHAASSKAPAAASKPALAPKPVAAAKAAPTAAKPAAKPGGQSSKAAGKAVIVRDSPF